LTQTLFAIGKVSKAFGLRGDIVVTPMTENPARFKKLKHIFLGRRPDQVSKFTVQRVHVEQRGVRVKLVETPDRTSAERLTGSLMFVDEEQRVVPPKGSHFIHDVIGLHVVDEQRKSLGVVKDVLRYPAHDIYVIQGHGREWMIPAVKEFIRSIDESAKVMRVRLIEGMREQS
jgi:16S rRNA processing protein RimM